MTTEEDKGARPAQRTGPTAASEDTGPANSGDISGRRGEAEGRTPLGEKPDESRQNPGTVWQKAGGEPLPRMPHERDESHQSQHTGTRPVGRQAASDLEQGLEETDLYASRGQRQGPPGSTAEHPEGDAKQ